MEKAVVVDASVWVSRLIPSADAIYVAVAKQLNIPLISWDKEQLRKASSLLTTYTPETYT